MADTDDVAVTVRIPPGQHTEWTEYVDESGDVNTLSQLIRMAVTQEISDDDIGGIPEDVIDEISGMRRDLSRLNTEVDSMNDSISSLHTTVQEVHERTVMKNRLYRLLPTDEDDAISVQEAGELLDKPDDVSKVLLDELVLEYPDVSTVNRYDQEAYYREA